MNFNFFQPFSNTFQDRSNISKSIFALRKSGKLQDAYNLIKDNLPVDYPNSKIQYDRDKWFVIAIVNVLIDLIKHEAQNTNPNYQLLEEYKYYISGIELGNDENSLSMSRRIESAISQANPYHYLLEKFNQIPEKERNQEAIGILSEYRTKSKDSSKDLTLGWRIYHYIKEELDSNEMFDFKTIKHHLNLYLKLAIPADKKALLHKSIVIQAHQLKKIINKKNLEFNFAKFLDLWGLKNLTEDYWVAKDKYKPWAITLIVDAVKEINGSNNVETDLANNYVPYMREVIKKDPDDIWNYLYLSRLLVKINSREEAKEYFIRVLKNKITESWAWNEIGTLCTEVNLSIACYCKALICKGEEIFKNNIHKNLADALLNIDDYSHAKTEYMIYFSNKKQLSEIDEKLQQVWWFIQTRESDDNNEFYIKHAQSADKILCESIPFIKAVLGSPETYFDAKKNKNVTVDVIYGQIKSNLKFENISCKGIPLKIKVKNHSLLSNVENKSGTYLQIKGEFNNENSFVVYYAEQDSSNSKGVFEEVVGVVSHISDDQTFAIVVIDKNCTVKIKIEDSKQYTLGMGLKLLIYYYKTKDKNIKFSVSKVIDKLDICKLPDYLAKKFTGYINNCYHDLAFTDNVMIPTHLVKKFNLSANVKVEGFAYLSYNKKKNNWGYVAAEITEVGNQSQT